MRLSPEAQGIFRELHNTLEPKLSRFGELSEVTDFGGKLLGHVGRIALALHFLSGRSGSDPVEAETMESAAAFSDFLVAHYVRLVTRVIQSEPDQMEARALDWIKRESLLGFTKNAMFNALRTSAHPKVSDWEPVLTRMTTNGYIRQAPPEHDGPGRPSTRYEVNPALLKSPPQNTRNTRNTPPPQAAPANNAYSAYSAGGGIEPCRACGGTRFWRSVHGALTCMECHPPPTPELVAEYVDAAETVEAQ